MKRMFRRTAFVLGWLSCGFVIGAVWPGFPYGYSRSEALAWLMTSGSHPTRYASNYSERAFARIQRGMSRDDVRNLAGQPLEKSTTMRGVETWSYSLPASNSGNFHARFVEFASDGMVCLIVRGFFSEECDYCWLD
ncbi:MAG: outer membrane protein assembly factor BamE [Verrucomicrobia bacterium]|nr:outer membrane protein assembly factor BamE [Verrucomicrobiota bacterium]